MDLKAPNTLPKKERLCSKTEIDRLLANGRFCNLTGLRFLYLKTTEDNGNRIMISVPKKFFKRAVKRNLLKRRLRECWRKQKHEMKVTGVDLLMMYSTKEVLSYEELYALVGKMIERINLSVKKTEEYNNVQ